MVVDAVDDVFSVKTNIILTRTSEEPCDVEYMHGVVTIPVGYVHGRHGGGINRGISCRKVYHV